MAIAPGSRVAIGPSPFTDQRNDVTHLHAAPCGNRGMGETTGQVARVQRIPVGLGHAGTDEWHHLSDDGEVASRGRARRAAGDGRDGVPRPGAALGEWLYLVVGDTEGQGLAGPRGTLRGRIVCDGLTGGK